MEKFEHFHQNKIKAEHDVYEVINLALELLNYWSRFYKNDKAENLVLDAKTKEKEALDGDDAVLGEMQAIVSKLNKDKETGVTIDIFA